MNKTYDAIVIGSGFGGAITAHQLALAGVKTALLERGPWRRTRPVLGAGITDTAPLPQNKAFYTHMLRNAHIMFNRNGMYELFYSNKTLIACASGVGGGSHAYTALHHKPKDPNYWQGVSECIKPQSMENHYEDFINEMGSNFPANSEAIPNQTRHLYKDHPLLKVDKNTWQPRMGMLFSQDEHKFPTRAPSNYQDEGLLGSYNGSKTTLDVAYLFAAMSHGLTVKDCCEAHYIIRNHATAGKRYRVDSYNHKTRQYQSHHADYVFLGAGTLNTLKLLFRSRAQKMLSGMTQLGCNFATNADSIAFWALQSPTIDYSRGLPCHGPVAFCDNDEAQYIQAGVSGLDQIPMPNILKRKLRGSVFFIGMGEDNNNGKVFWNKNRLTINYSIKEQQIYRAIHNNFERLKTTFQKPLLYSKSIATTVHPLGGAPINDDSELGLLSGNGEIHEHPGLFITDATALPKSPGMPPSMSIAAWSKHVAQSFIETNGIKSKNEETPHAVCN